MGSDLQVRNPISAFERGSRNVGASLDVLSQIQYSLPEDGACIAECSNLVAQLCRHNADLRSHVLHFQEVDSCHLSLARSHAGTNDCVVVFCIDSSPLSAHSGQLFGGVRDIWNRIDLTRATHIRVDLLYFRFWPAEKGTAHFNYDGPPRAVSSFSVPFTSIGTAEKRTVHACALHCLWHASRHHACDRLLLLGDDLVV